MIGPNAIVTIGSARFGNSLPLALIAGPCVIETKELTLEIAAELKAICGRVKVPLIFKASFDKANRSSGDSFRGPGLEEGLNEHMSKDTGGSESSPVSGARCKSKHFFGGEQRLPSRDPSNCRLSGERTIGRI